MSVEPLEVETGALVECGSAGRDVASWVSSEMGISFPSSAFEWARRPTAKGVGVKGGGLAGDS